MPPLALSQSTMASCWPRVSPMAVEESAPSDSAAAFACSLLTYHMPTRIVSLSSPGASPSPDDGAGPAGALCAGGAGPAAPLGVAASAPPPGAAPAGVDAAAAFEPEGLP